MNVGIKFVILEEVHIMAASTWTRITPTCTNGFERMEMEMVDYLSIWFDCIQTTSQIDTAKEILGVAEWTMINDITLYCLSGPMCTCGEFDK